MKSDYAVKLVDAVAGALYGKRDVVELAVITLLAEGHLLIEDVPGVGKTTLALALASASGCTPGRVQFTPDTMPSDVCGVSIYNAATGQFEYSQGVIMRNILLADEINRTPPKTQSALLEAMEESQVTVDGETHRLPEPFFVIATQNPIEHAGTYALPEAQIDRFMMKLSIGYPSEKDEADVIDSASRQELKRTVAPVTDRETVLAMRAEVGRVAVARAISEYITALVSLTRKDESLLLGASPRASISLVKAAQACAYLDGRNYVCPDDVKRVFPHVMRHRVMLTAKARSAGGTAEQIVHRISRSVTVPVL